MKAGRPSWTAELMAFFRALESVRPPSGRLFEDPFARVSSALSLDSELLFTYVHRGILDGAVAFEGAAAGSAAVRRRNEPYTFGFDPADLPRYLAARDLALVEDVGAPDYRARYLGPLGREMKIWEFYRVARARIVGAQRNFRSGHHG